MQHSKAVILYSCPPSIDRAKVNGVYASLSSADYEALFLAVFNDVVEKICQIPDTDVVVFRDQMEWSDDFLSCFMKNVKFGNVQGNTFAEQVQMSLEQTFNRGYSRVIVFFDIHPLIETKVIERVYAQLSFEDDCVVFGQYLNGKPFFLGFKQHPANLFENLDKEQLTEPSVILKRLCEYEIMVFPVQTLYPLDTSDNLRQLEHELQQLGIQKLARPLRTHTFLRSLIKKHQAKMKL